MCFHLSLSKQTKLKILEEEINKDAGATGTEHTTQQKRTDDAEMVNDSDTSVSNEVKCYIFINKILKLIEPIESMYSHEILYFYTKS